MLIGGHFPISKGLYNAIVLTTEARGNTLQIFSKNPGQWKARTIPDAEASEFKRLAGENGIFPIIIHDSYLINLATVNDTLREKSLSAFVEELERARQLGAQYLVTHMGSPGGANEDKGLQLLAKSICSSIQATEGSEVGILLETTSGQGTQLGYCFEHIARVIELCNGHPRIGVCLDTCHVFAAGYNIADDEGYIRTFEEFDRLIGWERLREVHLNDSKKPPGSRVDRHELLGDGFIGIEAFRRIIRDERFENIPLILETPKPEINHKRQIELCRKLKEDTLHSS